MRSGAYYYLTKLYDVEMLLTMGEHRGARSQQLEEGHVAVDEDDVATPRIPIEDMKSRDVVLRAVDLIPRGRQMLAQQLEIEGIVIDDEHPRRIGLRGVLAMIAVRRRQNRRRFPQESLFDPIFRALPR